MENCIFCSKDVTDAKILENKLAFVIYDKYPQAPGHLLVIPKRHSKNYFELTNEEKIAIDEILVDAKHFLDYKYGPSGYNIIANCGKSAGQVVFHTHVHLIPRK